MILSWCACGEGWSDVVQSAIVIRLGVFVQVFQHSGSVCFIICVGYRGYASQSKLFWQSAQDAGRLAQLVILAN